MEARPTLNHCVIGFTLSFSALDRIERVAHPDPANVCTAFTRHNGAGNTRRPYSKR
jgi:hypothetical protein